MRKVNAILGAALVVLLLFHAICGALKLTAVIPGGSLFMQIASYLLLGLCIIHALIGVKLTVDTLRSCKKSGVSSFRNNEGFWISRCSGFALLFLIAYHALTFMSQQAEVFRLAAFQVPQLVIHLLLVLALLLHLLTNIRPLFISLGLNHRTYLRDFLVILSIVLLVCAAAFFFYYLRWNVFWRY